MQDLIIIGGGPAGLAAALYSARYNLKTLLIAEKPGGEMANAPFVENYPGFEKISGADLTAKITEQVKKMGVKIVTAKATDIKEISEDFEVATNQDQKFQAKTLLLAVGMERRKLGVKGEKEFAGKGLSYCATCDGPLYKGKTVAVIGGGDAGLAAAFHLTQICKKVYIIEILKESKAEPYWQKKIKTKKNIEILLDTKVKEIFGDQTVQGVVLETSKGEKKLKVEGVFVEIGSVPNTDLAKKLKLKLDEKGFIVIDQSSATNKKGIWAAGDITTGSDYFWQILPSMSEGVIAAHSIFKYSK